MLDYAECLYFKGFEHEFKCIVADRNLFLVFFNHVAFISLFNIETEFD